MNKFIVQTNNMIGKGNNTRKKGITMLGMLEIMRAYQEVNKNGFTQGEKQDLLVYIYESTLGISFKYEMVWFKDDIVGWQSTGL